MVQQQTLQGYRDKYAKEMEQFSAKKFLLLAFKDSGGFQALISRKMTEMQRIDVNERIVGLERLNPTPRRTISPFLERKWNLEWFGAGSPGLAQDYLLQGLCWSRMDALPIEEHMWRLMENTLSMQCAGIYLMAHKPLVFEIESKFLLTTRLSVEGHTRMKEEYVEGLLETPTVSEAAVPEQLKVSAGQAAGTL